LFKEIKRTTKFKNITTLPNFFLIKIVTRLNPIPCITPAISKKLTTDTRFKIKFIN